MAKFVCARTRRRCVSILRCAVVIGTSVLLVVGEDAWAATAADSQPSSCAAAQPSRLIGEPHGPSFAQKAQPQLTPEQVANRLDKLFSIIAEADRQIPRDTFDPQAIIDKTGKNPTKIFEWVRDHTYFVPYRGLLRGDKGVLMDRLGNSLDRAMLLYSLLQVAGQSARMAHGTLTEAQAQDVLKKVRPFPSLEERIGSNWSPTISSALAKRFAQENQIDLAEVQQQLQQLAAQEKAVELKVKSRVATQTAAIAAAVGHPPASVAAEEHADQVRATTDHWWVEWQNGGNWTNLDPTLPGLLPGQALTTVQSTVAPKDYTDVGEKLVHTVEINVVIEVWKQGRVKEVTALGQKVVPAEVVGEPIALRQNPVHWPQDVNVFEEKDPVAAFKKAALVQTEWLPVLTVGSHSLSRYSFNDSGDLNNPASPLAHAEEQGVGGLGGAIGGMLGSHQIAPAPKPAVKSQPGRVTAEWIDYVIQAPGKPTQTIRREIFDLIGPAARAAGGAIPAPQMTESQKLDRALSLVDTIDILPLAAQPSPEFILHSSDENLLSKRALLKLIREGISRGTTNFLNEAGSLKPAVAEQLNSLAFASFEWSGNQSAMYLDQPNVLSYHKRPVVNGAGRLLVEQGFDIVANNIGVVSSPKKDAFLVRLEEGVLDTNAEAVLAGPTSETENTANAFAEAIAQGRKWLPIQNEKSPVWGKAELVTDTRARVLEDLRNGNSVVVPPTTSGLNSCRTGCWWRINLRTGDTLGIGDHGWGQTSVEYMKTVTTVLALVYGTVNAIECFVDARGDRSQIRSQGFNSESPGSWYALFCFDAGLMCAGVLLVVVALLIFGGGPAVLVVAESGAGLGVGCGASGFATGQVGWLRRHGYL